MKALLSKTSLFLAFHRFHITQGQRGAFKPTGGRGTKFLPCLIKSETETVVLGGLWSVGVRSQTSSANGQVRNTCRSSSWAPHFLQLNRGRPLLSRLALTGMAFFTTLHRKSFNFGLVLMFQMCCSQFTGSFSWFNCLVVVIPIPYPVFVE